MMNPIQVLKTFLGNGGNPQDLILKTINANNSNPMINNLVNLAQKGNKEEVEKIARNICKEKNIDFDKEFANFMKNVKG